MKLKPILYECAEGVHEKCPVTIDPKRFSGCECHCHPQKVDIIHTDKGSLIEVASLDGPGYVGIHLKGEPVGGFICVNKAKLYILYNPQLTHETSKR
jgi:hypothetical protein